jgi:hypothetical protein
MSRKHFAALAASLLESRPAPTQCDDYQARYSVWRQTVENVTDSIGQFNANFDKHRFLQAAGVE